MKVAKNEWWLLGLFKKKITAWINYYIGQLLETFGLFFTPTSGHTDHERWSDRRIDWYHAWAKIALTSAYEVRSNDDDDDAERWSLSSCKINSILFHVKRTSSLYDFEQSMSVVKATAKCSTDCYLRLVGTEAPFCE